MNGKRVTESMVSGGTVAARHARNNVVTASIDRMNFHKPVYIGNLITLKASLNMVGTTSMEVGVRVEAEDLLTGEVWHTASAYLTYVALDSNSNPIRIPPLIVENNEQTRRYQEANERRELRQLERQRESFRQKDEGKG
jgi:acyl-CoA hydrolase